MEDNNNRLFDKTINMDNNSLVTIGIMTYNQSQYILDTLKSIISQTYSNIELIVLDDCSTDNTVNKIIEIEDEIKQRFVRYKLIVHKKNSGNISKNNNELIAESKGKYFRSIGGDDLLLPDFTSKTVEFLENHHEYGIVFTDAYVVDGSYKYGDSINGLKKYMTETVPATANENFNKLLYSDYLPGIAFLTYTDIFNNVGRYDERLKIEDYAMWLKLSYNGINIGYIDEPYVLYRVSGNSLSNFSKDKDKGTEKFTNLLKYEIELVEFYKKDINENEFLNIMQVKMENFCFIALRSNVSDGDIIIQREINRLNLPFSAVNFMRGNNEVSIYTCWQDNAARQYLKNYFDGKHINNVAVYGYGARGKRFVNFLERVNIPVKYLIDRYKGDEHQYCVYSPEEQLPIVDAVIVSPFGIINDSLINKIKGYGIKNVISLNEIIENYALKYNL